MTLKRNTFEGYAPGVQPTAGTSGGASGDAFSVVAFGGAVGTVVDAPVPRGTRALRVVADPVTGTGLVELTTAPHKRQAAQCYLRMAALPSAEFTLISGRTATGAVWGINLKPDGALRFPSGPTTPDRDAATSPPIGLDSWVLVDFVMEQAASPTTDNGIATYQLTRVSTGAVFYSASVANAGLGTTTPDRTRYGKTGGSSSTDLFIAYPAADDAATAFIAPIVDFVPPTLVVDPTSATAVAGSHNAVPTATGYQYEVAPDVSGAPGAWAPVTDADAADRAFTVTGLTAGAAYWFRGRSVN